MSHFRPAVIFPFLRIIWPLSLMSTNPSNWLPFSNTIFQSEVGGVCFLLIFFFHNGCVIFKKSFGLFLVVEKTHILAASGVS